MDDAHSPAEQTRQESDYTEVSFIRILAFPACLLLIVLGVVVCSDPSAGSSPRISNIVLIYIAFVLTLIVDRLTLIVRSRK
jgi:hypothetical protein